MENQPIHPWWRDAIFYHIYPLGLCGALYTNDFSSTPVERLNTVDEWIPHLLDLGVNALYIGPLFESTYHGYDTADYTRVDRRLGTNAGLEQLCRRLHENGIRVVFDAVFNHVGRDFFAFRDVQQHGSASRYCGWFDGLDFNDRSLYNDAFSYKGWSGNFDLVKLNLANPEVREYLFNAVRGWIDEFSIDGLRLDAADCLAGQFLKDLRRLTTDLKPDFWLMGEIVAGDYRSLANCEMLHSATNYECYKGLYSSLVDMNYFEIAWALNRQFGLEGIYKDLTLYNFADNHDVNRVASSLGDPALLYPLYCLLFTMPGIPSIYYGSEWGLTGKRTLHNDSALRPALELKAAIASAPQPELPGALRRLTDLRKTCELLKIGGYTQLFVSHQQFAFLREYNEQRVIVALNASASPAAMNIPLQCSATHSVDLLNDGAGFPVQNNSLALPSVPPCWAHVLRLE